MNIKIRPTILIISLGLVIALIWAVVTKEVGMVSTLSVALIGALTKLVESEEATNK